MVGIGITSRGQIPRSELGPAMGPMPAAAAGRIGIGFNRANEVLPLTPAYAWQASQPTDEPTTLEPRTREQAAADVGQAQAAVAGVASPGIGRFELRDVARALGGILQFGGRLIGNPAAFAIGQGLQRVAGPATPRAPAPAAPTIERAAADVAGKAEAAIGPDGYALQASRGTADLAAGVGSVQTVQGERQFSFEPFAFADGTAAGDGTAPEGGGGQRGQAF